MSQNTEATISIYDTQGQLIRKLELGFILAGKYVGADRAIYWNGRTETGETLASGTYFYQIATGEHASNTEIELTEMEVICQFIFGMLLLPVFLYAQEKSSGKKMARKWFWFPQAHLKELAYTPTYGGFR